MRGFLPGFSYQVGVLIAAIAPFIEATMSRRFTYAQVMGTFAGVVMVVAMIVIGLGPEAHPIAFGRNTT
jgi:SHS family lactate transporter-like MFS transporter